MVVSSIDDQATSGSVQHHLLTARDGVAVVNGAARDELTAATGRTTTTGVGRRLAVTVGCYAIAGNGIICLYDRL